MFGLGKLKELQEATELVGVMAKKIEKLERDLLDYKEELSVYMDMQENLNVNLSNTEEHRELLDFIEDLQSNLQPLGKVERDFYALTHKPNETLLKELEQQSGYKARYIDGCIKLQYFYEIRGREVEHMVAKDNQRLQEIQRLNATLDKLQLGLDSQRSLTVYYKERSENMQMQRDALKTELCGLQHEAQDITDNRDKWYAAYNHVKVNYDLLRQLKRLQGIDSEPAK